MNSLPKSPREMPTELWNDAQWVRSFFFLAAGWDWFHIYYESADVRDDDTPAGTWTVAAEHGTRQVDCTYEGTHPAPALWYVKQHIEAAERSEWERGQAEKLAALAKLTPRERELLGVS